MRVLVVLLTLEMHTIKMLSITINSVFEVLNTMSVMRRLAFNYINYINQIIVIFEKKYRVTFDVFVNTILIL